MSGALLSGWGRTAPSFARVVRPATAQDVVAALAGAAPRGALARGLGRAYGDAAQNAGGVVLDTSALDAVGAVEEGTVTVGGGLSLDRLLRELVPQGWFPPVVPGTRHVTLGGALACDIHGKNHHVAGSLSRHVEWIELATPGGVRRLAADDPAFRATAGGMGLTGVVTTLRLRLLGVPSSAVRVTTERAHDLDDLMARMEARDDQFRYSVAWIDCLAGGRGILTRGDHAPEGELRFEPRDRLRAFAVPRLLNRTTMRAFNAAYFRLPRPAESHQDATAFFWPLDGVREWNRLYASGLIQYQAVVPFGEEEALRRLVGCFGETGFLAVLKRFGPGAPLLSFPQPGWTLAVDVPAQAPGIAQLLDGADELVARAGGRVYLAKDARLRPELLAAMYPELDEWRAIRAELDPDGRMTSDLARRLGL